MRHVLRLPVKSDVGIFLLLVILSVGIMAVDRLNEDSPLTGRLAALFVPFESLSYRLMDFSFIQKENHILRAKLMDVSRENALLQEQASEAERLRGLVDFRTSHPGTLCCARVIGEPGERMGGGIVIDKGRAAGLVKNMTVVSPDGLVGRIIKVGEGASQVRRIIDPGYRVSALIQRNRATGILGTRSDGRIVMEWVAPDADVVAGDVVSSSGLGSITPKGIPVGKVGRIKEKPERFSLALEVKPFADFSRLEEVFVILRKPPDFQLLLDDEEESEVEH
ncbi:MAG: rod shape-determining protein MreC [Candidatus Eisenbacteria bacterium]